MAKKTFFKKTLAFALAVILTVGAGPLAGLCGLELPSISSFVASAAEEEPVWTIATDDMLVIEGNTITGYTDKLSGNIEIPTNTSNGTAITTIASGAFENCSDLTAVKIPETIISIGWYAFKNTGLETVYFHATACEMGSNANEGYSTFTDNANLTKFVFGENVSKIPANACASAKNLQKVEFEGTVTEIGENAFFNCPSLSAIDLSNVKTIGESAFKDCTTLKVTDKNTSTADDKGTIVFSDNLLTIYDYAFENCTSIKEVTIPEKVTYVGWKAFKNTGLETVYFHATACEMGSNANEGYSTFTDNANLTKFVFGENVTKIPVNACASATNICEIVINGLTTTIEKNAFYNCTSLSDVYYNAGSKEDWNSITINSGNDILSSADVTIHFGIKPEEKRNEKFDVTASYISNAFTEEVDIAVTEVDGTHENGSVNILDNEIREMVGCFNIKMVSVETGKAVQPVNGKTVTITMPIPQQYLGKKNFRIIHELENGARENFATNAPNSKNRIEITSDGKYLKFNVSSFSKFEVMTFELLPAVSIKNNTGSKTISYGETLRLTANTSNMPADAKIFWYVDGVKKGEGTTFEVSPESGSVEVTVKVVDVNGNDYADTDISDTEKVTVKSGFFQKLISFFKNLFRISRVVTQAFSVK